MSFVIEMVPSGDLRKALPEARKDEWIILEAAHTWIEAQSKDRIFKDYRDIQAFLEEGAKYLDLKGLGREHGLLLTLTPGKRDHIEFTIGGGRNEGPKRFAILAKVAESAAKRLPSDEPPP